ncbi:MAG: hypothetical protein HC871_16215 [Rhizobiales bacterium]|nr:hypothetical protein [Hyphomicrobiales bacterium]
MLLTMSMLSACGGGPRPQIEHRLGERGTTPPESHAPESYAEAVEAMTVEATHQDALSARLDAVPAAHRGDPRRHPRDRHAHLHEEPGPETQRIAEAALILTGSVFLCTFVVVVLDGACEFGVGFGYHYY